MAQLKTLTINDTGFIKLPSGTTAQRPSVPTTGMMRFNTDLSCNEYYDGTNWIDPVTGAAPVVTNGLVLNLDAGISRSYPGSGILWRDLSGYGNNGTLTNGPTFSSANGGSLVFDGVNDYSSSSLSVSSASLTVEITFKINVAGNFVDIAVLDDGTNELLLELGGNNGFPNTNGYLRYYTTYSGSAIGNVSDSLASSSQYILDSKIHTSVLTVGSSLASSYFNGVFQGSGSVAESKTFTRLVLANDLLRASRACSCNIYQVKIYNRALTATEILNNYNSLKGRFGL